MGLGVTGGRTVFDIGSLDDLLNVRVRTDNHCFGCTAGMGPDRVLRPKNRFGPRRSTSVVMFVVLKTSPTRRRLLLASAFDSSLCDILMLILELVAVWWVYR